MGMVLEELCLTTFAWFVIIFVSLFNPSLQNYPTIGIYDHFCLIKTKAEA